MLVYKMKRETLNCLLCFLLGYVISQMMAKKSSCGSPGCAGCAGCNGGNLIEGNNCHDT